MDAEVNRVEDQALFELELDLLLQAIYARYHHDFRHYARSSVRRRIRQALDRLNVSSLSALQDRILRDSNAFSTLFSYLRIGVTEMFRDPAFFKALRERVVPVLATYPSIKIWVAGCSTGEEVYSLQILLREEALAERALIYATDIDADALEKARQGIYPLERMAGFSAAYLQAGGRSSLSDYYLAGEHAAIFDRSLRDNVVFSDHSLATDGVFATVEMVVCRNVLIYFDPVLQERSLQLFHESLTNGGLLALGSKETVRFTAQSDRYGDFCPDQRIFRRQ